MRLLTIMIILSLALLMPQTTAHAGTLVLRNGRRVTGRFLEKGEDYVVVKTIKGPLKIRKRLMDKNSWQNFTPEGDELVAPAVDLSPVQRARDNWSQWYAGPAGYLAVIDENFFLLNSAENVLAESAIGLSEDLLYTGYRLKVDEAFVSLRQVSMKFKDIKVPTDLQDFHELHLDYQNTLLRSAKSYLMDDGRAYALSLHRCRLSFLESQEVLRAIFIYHGAPQDMIDLIDINIQAYEETIPYDMMYRYRKNQKRNPYVVPGLR